MTYLFADDDFNWTNANSLYATHFGANGGAVPMVLQANTGYRFESNLSAEIFLSLPPSPKVGDQVKVYCGNNNLYRILPPTNGSIFVDEGLSVTHHANLLPSISSVNAYGGIELICTDISPNIVWVVLFIKGNCRARDLNGAYLRVGVNRTTIFPNIGTDFKNTGAGILRQNALGGQIAVAALVAGDIPSLDAGKINSGTFAISLLPVASSGASSATQVVRADDSRLANSRTPTTHAASHVSGGSDAIAGSLDANARIAVTKAGAAVGTRRRLNFIEGPNVSLTIGDDPANEEVDITVSSSGGAAGVTSVGLALPAIFTVSGSPVTTAGTLTGTLTNQAANQVWGGPVSGIPAAPTFRSLVADDIPGIDGSKIVSGSINLQPLSTSEAGQLNFFELAANGTNKATLKASDAMAADRVITLPNNSGTLALTSTTVATSRTITSSGAGITGGGDLGANRVFSLSTALQNFAGVSFGTNALTVSTGADTFAAVAPNVTTTRQFLAQSGNGTTATIPAWGAIAQTDLPIMTGATSSVAGTRGAVPVPAAGDNTKFLGGDGTWKTVENYILIVDEKAAGVHGGTFTAGAWQTRILNTKRSDTGSNATLASNQITLTAGTYRCYISAPAYYTAPHKTRLRNISDSTTTLVGTSETTQNQGDGMQNRSFIVGSFSIASSKVFEVQHRCITTAPNTGLGVATNVGEVEVYTMAEFWKVA